MLTTVALFRGINVGKAKRISMAELRAVFEELGYAEVRTVLQSGNVVFASARPLTAKAAQRIEAAVLARTGVESAVLLVGAEDLEAIAAENPLVEVATDPSRLVVTFLPEPPDRRKLQLPDPKSLAPEVLAVGARAVYQWCPEGILASKVPPSFWKPLARATARNWRTVMKLVELAGGG